MRRASFSSTDSLPSLRNASELLVEAVVAADATEPVSAPRANRVSSAPSSSARR